MSYEEIKVLSAQAVGELLAVARTEPGEIFVVGCSSSGGICSLFMMVRSGE